MEKLSLKSFRTNLPRNLIGSQEYIVCFPDLPDTNTSSYFQFLIYPKKKEKSRLGLINCNKDTLSCTVAEILDLPSPIRSLIATVEGTYLYLQQKNEMMLLNTDWTLSEGPNIRYAADIQTAIYFQGSWVGYNSTGLYTLFLSDGELKERESLRKGEFVDLYSTKNYLIAQYKSKDTKNILILKTSLENLGGWERYVIPNFEQVISDVYEWNSFLVFYAKKDVVIFRFQEMGEKLDGMIKFQSSTLSLNRSSIVDEKMLLGIVPNGEELRSGLSLLEYEKEDNSFFLRQLLLNRLSLACQDAEHSDLLQQSLSLIVAYGWDLNQRRVEEYLVRFVEKGSGPSLLLIGMLVVVGGVLVIVVMLALLNFFLVVKRNSGGKLDRRIKREYLHAE